MGKGVSTTSNEILDCDLSSIGNISYTLGGNGCNRSLTYNSSLIVNE